MIRTIALIGLSLCMLICNSAICENYYDDSIVKIIEKYPDITHFLANSRSFSETYEYLIEYNSNDFNELQLVGYGEEIHRFWKPRDLYIYELYKGKEGGYLGVARTEDYVFCMQYINDDHNYVKYCLNYSIPDSIYQYETIYNMSLDNYRENIAYFIDGVGLVVSVRIRDVNDIPYYRNLDTETCIASHITYLTE